MHRMGCTIPIRTTLFCFNLLTATECFVKLLAMYGPLSLVSYGFAWLTGSMRYHDVGLGVNDARVAQCPCARCRTFWGTSMQYSNSRQSLPSKTLHWLVLSIQADEVTRI
jgi:hypothetical protein